MTEGTQQVSLGINETMEILDGLKELAVAGVKIAKDSKIGIDDIQYIVELAKKYDMFKDAVTGAEKVIPEFKDLDATEGAMLVAKVFEIISAIKAARV